MLEITGDLWEQNADAICITTNATIKMDKTAVMGGGCAREAADRFPQLPEILANKLRRHGNTSMILLHDQWDRAIVAFPTKPVDAIFDGNQALLVPSVRGKYRRGNPVQSWQFKTTPEILIASCKSLVKLANLHGWHSVIIPRPGCGLGGLDWDDVKPIIEPYLDDRFRIISF